jgi:hypothetical protein
MNANLDTFPISGTTISSLLGASFAPEQLWVLADIETLAADDAIVLGDIWRKVRSGPVTLSTREITELLNLASQVISLDMRLEADPLIEILIEDGVKIECRLS